MEYREKYNKVESLINRLHNTHLPLKERRGVVDYIRRHLASHPNDGLSLIEAGALKPLLGLISVILAGGRSFEAEGDPDAVQTVSAAVSLLLALSLAKSDAPELQTENSIRILLSLVSGNSNTTIRSRACRCLGNVLQTMQSSSAHAVVQKHLPAVCQAIVALFATPALYEVALRTVRQAVACLPLKRPLLRSDLFTTALIPLLASSDPQSPALLQQTLMCLTSFVMDSLEADVSAEVIARHLNPQLRRLVQLAGNETPGIQQSAIDLLCRLASNGTIRINMGSMGVVACFIEHLSFDDQQTTVSSVQKKIVYALTLCCRGDFNRAKMSDIGGMRVLMGVLGSSLYSSVHLHILSCLTEFKHDEGSLALMVTAYGAVGHAARYLNAALDVLFPSPANSDSDLSPADPINESPNPEATPSTSEDHPDSHVPSTSSGTGRPGTTPRRFSCRSPSYRNVIQESESRRQWDFSSPAFSPPAIDEELRRDLASAACTSPQSSFTAYSGTSSPSGPASPFSGQFGRLNDSGNSGRYSPVVEPEEDEDEAMPAEKEALPSLPSGASLLPSNKRKHEEDVEMETINRKKVHYEPRPSLSADDAKKCLQYIIAFFEAVSHRKNLVSALATSSVISGYVKYIERAPSQFQTTSEQTARVKSVFQTLLRIVMDPHCFEALVKVGLPLILQDSPVDLPASAVKAKKDALSHLRLHAGGEFGFGEMLHLSLCSSRQIRMNCITCASVLIQNRPDRVKFFKKQAILDQLMEALLDFTSGTEHRRMVAQALHGFFLDEVSVEDALTFPGLSGDAEPPLACCLSETTDNMDVDHDRGTFLLDDGSSLPVSRATLSSNSEVFAAMLGRSFLEGQAASPVIPIRDTPAAAFTALVHFFTGCHLTSCPVLITVFEQADDLLDLVQLSDRFLAFKLRDFAAQALVGQRLDGGNVGRLFEGCQWLQLDFLGERMIERVLKRPEMGLQQRTVLLNGLLQSDCAPVAVNFIRVLLETAM